MCDPVTLTVTGIVLASAAGGVAAYGQYQAGQASDAYYKALADQNDREAQMAKDTADQQTSILQNEAAQKSKELSGDVKTIKGTQKASMAAMGLYGITADDILGDTVNKAKLDAANIRYNADIQSWALKKEANERGWALNNQANAFRMAGKQAKTASYLNMTATLLGTASSIFSGLGKLNDLTGKGSVITGGQGGSIVQTGPQSVGGHSFTTAWSPYKL